MAVVDADVIPPQRPIPIYTFAEQEMNRPTTLTVADRPTLAAAVQAAMPGLSQVFLDGLTDATLAELAKNLPGGGTTAASADPAKI